MRGRHPALGVHLTAWARKRGHGLDVDGGVPVIVKGRADDDRWRSAERAGGADPSAVVGRAPARWGLAARGALVESGGPPLAADLVDRDVVLS